MRKLSLSLLCLALFEFTTAHADVKLPPVLSNHLVLQRDVAVPIWGTAAPQEKITVKFRTQEKTATADKDGKWAVKLDALKAGGPDKLTVSGTNTVTLEDVLVGEVWLGSGQSNMAGAVNGYLKDDEVLTKLANESYPKLRLHKAGKWQAATPETIKTFSALLFAFGQRLHKDLDVPVGLMVGAVGGTPSGYWLSQEAFDADATCQDLVKKLAVDYPYDKLVEKHKEALAKWEKDVKEAKDAGKTPPRKPLGPAKPGMMPDGKIGQLYEAHIRPLVPFAIRGVLWDQGEAGTRVTGVDQYNLMGALIKGWRKDWNQGEFAFIYVQKPSGEGCAWDLKDPVTMRASPFAPLPPSVPKLGEGLNRETYVRIRNHPKTAMVTASDLGGNTHPVNKSGYGERAARVALGMVYEKKVEIYGPVYDSAKIDGGKITLSFTHTGKGLAFMGGGKLQGFAIAGEDKAFHWADAVIEGDKVIVSSDKVKQPVAVRYAWAQKHPWANLFNKDGLPALPFRTDNWTKD